MKGIDKHETLGQIGFVHFRMDPSSWATPAVIFQNASNKEKYIFVFELQLLCFLAYFGINKKRK
jgi:hypothetical protein